MFWSEIKPKLFGFPVHSLVSTLIIPFAKAECFDNIPLKKFNHAYVVVQFSLSTVQIQHHLFLTSALDGGSELDASGVRGSLLPGTMTCKERNKRDSFCK